MVNIVKTVNLETLSTLSGNKDFIAVGTSVHRGEDLAVRGAVRIIRLGIGHISLTAFRPMFLK